MQNFRFSAPRRSRVGSSLLLVCAVLTPATAIAQQSLTPDEVTNIEKDTARHFGDAPADPVDAGRRRADHARPQIGRAHV